jgi:hypothetical protein
MFKAPSLFWYLPTGFFAIVCASETPMPTLSWFTGQIDFQDFTPTLTAEAFTNIEKHPELQISFAHEYTHFLQVVTSVAGVRLLADLVDLGVRGALLLSGKIELGEVVSGYRELLPLLRDLPAAYWQTHEGVAARRAETMDEARAMLEPTTFPYSGQKGTWEVDCQTIRHGTYVEPVWGMVIRGSTGAEFQPFTIGFLAESMARRVDRWLARRVAPDHVWSHSSTETNFYNGLMHVLSHHRFGELSGHNLEEIAVVLATLALGTHRPDESLARMLHRLETPIPGGALTANVVKELRALLIQLHAFHADHYNEAISDVMWGAARIMNRSEYLEIHRRLVQIHEAANRVLVNPAYFVTPQLDWTTIERWMRMFPPPPIALGGSSFAKQVGAQICESFATTFLTEVERVLLQEPAPSANIVV